MSGQRCAPASQTTGRARLLLAGLALPDQAGEAVQGRGHVHAVEPVAMLAGQLQDVGPALRLLEQAVEPGRAGRLLLCTSCCRLSLPRLLVWSVRSLGCCQLLMAEPLSGSAC